MVGSGLSGEVLGRFLGDAGDVLVKFWGLKIVWSLGQFRKPAWILVSESQHRLLEDGIWQKQILNMFLFPENPAPGRDLRHLVWLGLSK